MAKKSEVTIKMKTGMAGDRFSHQAGDVLTVEAKVAAAWIAADIAEKFEGHADKTEVLKAKAEAAEQRAKAEAAGDAIAQAKAEAAEQRAKAEAAGDAIAQAKAETDEALGEVEILRAHLAEEVAAGESLRAECQDLEEQVEALGAALAEANEKRADAESGLRQALSEFEAGKQAWEQMAGEVAKEARAQGAKKREKLEADNKKLQARVAELEGK